MSRVGWLDCSAGASGDMVLGAVVGAGVPLDVPAAAVAALDLPEQPRLRVEHVTRAGLAATRVHVEAGPSAGPRRWADIRDLLAGAGLDPRVRSRATATFAALADAEAAVHGTGPDEVHFHEVGAVDALADIVAACAGLSALGLDALHASPVALGGGTVDAAHGRLPVPTPAVLRLLQGVPVHGGPVDAETCTPTGAALLATWVDGFGPLPALIPESVGVGAGGRDPSGYPNVLRLVVGDATVDLSTEALVLECNVDDLDPRAWPHVLAALMTAGAADAWLTPILMKKGRPAHTLAVLVDAATVEPVRAAVFRETTTLGMRETAVRKRALDRSSATVDVDGVPVRVKTGSLAGRVVNAMPEWDDVAAAADRLRRPVKDVLARAQAEADRLRR